MPIERVPASGTDNFRLAAFGRIPTLVPIIKFGTNPSIGTGTTPEDVWSGGGLYTGQPLHADAAESLTISSSSVLDNGVTPNTGARTLVLAGIDENWDYQVRTIFLNGTTPVITTSLWRRMFRSFVETAGSTGGNQGIITVNHTTTTANVFAAIPVSQNSTLIGAFTTARSVEMLLIQYDLGMAVSGGVAASADITILTRKEDQVYRPISKTRVIASSRDAAVLATGLPIREKTDIKFQVDAVSNNNTEVDVVFETLLCGPEDALAPIRDIN